MLSKINFIALVAARSGSKGIKNKNFIKINKKNIVKAACEMASQINEIQNVILSSDSISILDLAPVNKKILKIKRSKKLAQDKTPMLPVLKNSILYYEKLKNKRVDAVIIFDPTAPLRLKEDIIKGINLFKIKKPDLLVSVHECQHNPYFSMLEKKKFFYKLSKGKKNIGSRQEAPKVLEINTLVWIYSRKAVFVEKKRIPKKTIVLKTPYDRSIDIDTNEDIRKINYYLSTL
jgi:CMP-N,N'-diacetyllegionaminic acid synthase